MMAADWRSCCGCYLGQAACYQGTSYQSFQHRISSDNYVQFGGNPDHIVMSGDSAGGNAIDILLTANNGAGFPDFFVGAAVESTGWGSDPYAVDRDSSLAKNINSTGCLTATDPIDCMRMMPIAEFQNKTTKDGWGPTIDGEILMAPHYQMMEQGKFQQIPVIYGSEFPIILPPRLQHPEHFAKVNNQPPATKQPPTSSLINPPLRTLTWKITSAKPSAPP